MGGNYRPGSRGIVTDAVVPISRLISDRYELPAHISIVKIDIEGHEWGVLHDLAAMCRAGQLSLDSLHVLPSASPHPWSLVSSRLD